MHNIKLVLEYDGARYQGWQRLGKGESANTVANRLLDVIHKMTAEDVELFCRIIRSFLLSQICHRLILRLPRQPKRIRMLQYSKHRLKEKAREFFACFFLFFISSKR